MPFSIQDNEIIRAVAEYFPDGKWEFVQNQDEKPPQPAEPIPLTADEQAEMEEIIRAIPYEVTMDEICFAVSWGSPEWVECLLDEDNVEMKDNNGNTTLHLVARPANIEIVKFLISIEADVDARNKYGETPLHWALDELYEVVDRKQSAKYFDLGFEVVRLLVSAGADVYAKDSCGNTPYGTAKAIGRMGRPEIMEYLYSASKFYRDGNFEEAYEQS